MDWSWATPEGVRGGTPTSVESDHPRESQGLLHQVSHLAMVKNMIRLCKIAQSVSRKECDLSKSR